MNTRIATVLIGGIAALGLPAVADAKITRLTLTEVETTRILVVDAPPMQASESQPPNAGDVVAGRAKLMRGSKTVGSAEFFGVVTAFPLLEFYDDRRDDEEEGGQPDHVGVGARLLVLADYQQHHAVRGEDGERERERREKRSGVSRQKCRKNVAITKHGHRASSEHE
jgi:hypothetical protein